MELLENDRQDGYRFRAHQLRYQKIINGQKEQFAPVHEVKAPLDVLSPIAQSQPSDILRLSSQPDKHSRMEEEEFVKPFQDQFTHIIDFMSERFQRMQLIMDELHQRQDEILTRQDHENLCQRLWDQMDKYH